MTPEYAAAFVVAALAVLVIVDWLATFILGPDRDLQAPYDPTEPVRFAPCGDKNCHNPHPFREWKDRVR